MNRFTDRHVSAWPAPSRLAGHRPDRAGHRFSPERLPDHALDPATDHGSGADDFLPRAAVCAAPSGALRHAAGRVGGGAGFLWPFVLLLPSRLLPGALLTLVVGAAVFRAGCLQAGTSDFFRWFMLPASLDAFSAGAPVAWLMKRHEDRSLIPRRWMGAAGLFTLVCWVIARKLRYLEGTRHMGLALVDILETVTLTFLLVVLLQNLSTPILRLFSAKPLVYVGRVSSGPTMSCAVASSPWPASPWRGCPGSRWKNHS